MPRKYTGNATEHHEQAALVSAVLMQYQHRPDFIRLLFFATLNGVWIAGKDYSRKMGLIAKYKSEGWVNGVSDLLYLQPRGDHPYLAIEMKTVARIKEKDFGASEDQLAWLQAAKSAGAMTAICHGADAGFDVFHRYMNLDAKTPALSE